MRKRKPVQTAAEALRQLHELLVLRVQRAQRAGKQEEVRRLLTRREQVGELLAERASRRNRRENESRRESDLPLQLRFRGCDAC